MSLTREQRTEIIAPFIDLVTKYRKDKKYSQAKLASVAGLSVKYVTMVEAGLRTPSLENLLALMASSGVPKDAAAELLESLIGQFRWTRLTYK